MGSHCDQLCFALVLVPRSRLVYTFAAGGERGVIQCYRPKSCRESNEAAELTLLRAVKTITVTCEATTRISPELTGVRCSHENCRVKQLDTYATFDVYSGASTFVCEAVLTHEAEQIL